jgi:hypothetical protein
MAPIAAPVVMIQPSRMANPYAMIPPADPKAIASVEALGDSCAELFVDLNTEFTAAYIKWKATWKTGNSMGSSR